MDRTFNLNLEVSQAILEFLLARYQPGHFFHFEMVPDRLPERLRNLISQFPPGALQLEVGVQTFNPEVAARIQRRQDYERLEENLVYLRTQTGVHLHADLIAGLPGESIDSFGAGFDRLIALRPHEIQVGILKRLRGTPITRHDAEFGMVYSPYAPYEILRNQLIHFPDMQRLRRFARYWDLVGNSGNFLESVLLIWRDEGSPFRAFMQWSDYLYTHLRRTDGISLPTLVEGLFRFLTVEKHLSSDLVAETLCRDYQRPGRREIPKILEGRVPGAASRRTSPKPEASGKNKRQARHLLGD